MYFVGELYRIRVKFVWPGAMVYRRFFGSVLMCERLKNLSIGKIVFKNESDDAFLG